MNKISLIGLDGRRNGGTPITGSASMKLRWIPSNPTRTSLIDSNKGSTPQRDKNKNKINIETVSCCGNNVIISFYYSKTKRNPTKQLNEQINEWNLWNKWNEFDLWMIGVGLWMQWSGPFQPFCLIPSIIPKLFKFFELVHSTIFELVMGGCKPQSN